MPCFFPFLHLRLERKMHTNYSQFYLPAFVSVLQVQSCTLSTVSTVMSKVLILSHGVNRAFKFLQHSSVYLQPK